MFNCPRTQTAEAGHSRQVRKQMAMSEKTHTEPQAGETNLCRAWYISEAVKAVGIRLGLKERSGKGNEVQWSDHN